MRLPSDISEAAARRRSLLFDALGAIVIALVVIALSAGLGIVGAIALITLLVLAIWVGVEALLRRRARRARRGLRRRRGAVPAAERR